MELKKSKKADLEKIRIVFFQIGLLVVLSLILIAFDWKTEPDQENWQNFLITEKFEEELPASLPREAIKPPALKPFLIDIINIVPDDVEVDEPIFINPEATGETVYDYNRWNDGPEKIIDDIPFIVVEEMPKFNGGKAETEFTRYIAENTHYPAIAADNGIGGKVFVKFVVDSKGRVTDVTILSPVDPALDNEALRVITSSPLWTPGKQRSKPVKVQFVFPINFVLQ